MKTHYSKTTGLCLGLMVAAFASAMVARAATDGPYTSTIVKSLTDWDQSVSVKQFNPALGTLNSVKLTLEGAQHTASTVENLNKNSTKTFITGTAVYFTLFDSGPITNSLVVFPVTVIFTNTLLKSDSTAVFPNPPNNLNSGDDFASNPETGSSDTNSVVIAGSDPKSAQFIGAANLGLVINADATNVNLGPSDFAIVVHTEAGATLRVEYDYTPNAGPAYKLEKTAFSPTLNPFEKEKYTYTVTNTGDVPLDNISIVDDAGTPDFAGDDVTVTVPGTLAAGAAYSTDLYLYPPICMEGKLSTGPVVPAGQMIVQELPSGDIKITYRQDFGINDNTYGVPGCVGWPSDNHTFGNLVGSDKLEFRVFDKSGAVVLDLYMDTISQIGGIVNPANGLSKTYPSGYGTAGPFDNEGSMIAGNPAHLIDFSTSISDNLNLPLNLPKKAALILKSPTTDDGFENPVVDLTKAPGGWESINSYSITVSKDAFVNGGGFGSVAVPDQHNSPAKQGGHVIVPYPVPCCVTNIATAIATVQGTQTTITNQASAAMCIVTSDGSGDLGPWFSTDVGKCKKKGSATINGTAATVIGSGNDIEGDTDEFHFLYQKTTGDCTIIAKVVSVQSIEKQSIAGVMIRDTTSKDARHASMMVTSGEGIRAKWRSKTHKGTSNVRKLGKAPVWVKVQRVSNLFTMSYSKDNVNWTVAKTIFIPMTGTAPTGVVDIGLAVCSHKDNKLCTAQFEDISITNP